MQSPSDLKGVFRSTGLRWTPQREAIAAALWGAVDHPTAEEIFRLVRRRHPGMSQATVYNTIAALVAAGQVEALQSEDGTRRFDPNTDPHHHLRCCGCGRLVDLPVESFPKIPALPASVRKGFRVLGYRIEVQGFCPKCASPSRIGPADSSRRPKPSEDGNTKQR